MRFFYSWMLFLTTLFALPSSALAGPAGGSAQGSLSTRGATGSASGGGFQWPELVVGGNAVSFLAPLQVGMVGYLPKARFGFQYDRQLFKGHWVHVGAALLADRGDWETFRLPSCGIAGAVGGNVCEKGGVLGVDIYAGYSYKWFIQKHPYVVPIVRGSIGYSYWALPEVGGGAGNRRQIRTQTSALTLRPGGGVRLFLLDQLALGFDLNLPFGVLIHTDLPVGGEKDRKANFLLGIEILPVVVEWRF